MSDIYVVTDQAHRPVVAHTTWQGASEELAGKDGGWDVVNIELIEEDE